MSTQQDPADNPPAPNPSRPAPGELDPPPHKRPATPNSRRIGAWMFGLMWLILLGIGSLFAQRWFDQREAARAPISSVGENGRAAVQLSADRLGHYVVTGLVNGQPVTFLVDTGASSVSLPQSVADRLGLTRGPATRAVTANGSTMVYATTLDSVDIGGVFQRRVRAHINPSMDGSTALLGMSFLRHFELIQKDGQLTIRQP